MSQQDWDDEEEFDWEDEEDDLCGEWMSFGTEECEFCPHAEECRKATLEAMKKA